MATTCNQPGPNKFSTNPLIPRHTRRPIMQTLILVTPDQLIIRYKKKIIQISVLSQEKTHDQQ